MNSAERHERRYQRRKNRRLENKRKRAAQLAPFDEMFGFDMLIKSTKKSSNGTRWKTSTQNFEKQRFSQCAKLATELRLFAENEMGQYKIGKYKPFTITERGKIRHIEAPYMRDKVVQKIFAVETLHELYPSIMMYNNGASQKGKGTAFAHKLLKRDLVRHYKKYGKSGKIILIDFHDFFPAAAHWVIKERHNEIFGQEPLIRLGDAIVDSVKQGMPLGIEPSQYEMIAFPSKLDNFIRCQLHISGFGRYMDDYYVIVPPDRDANEILMAIKEKAYSLDLQFSDHKTKIIPFGKPFKYCKVKYIITDTGKIIKRGNPKNIQRARRKIKMFYRTNGDLLDVWSSVQSILGYLKQFHNHNDELKLRRLFYSLYGFSCEDFENFKEIIYE